LQLEKVNITWDYDNSRWVGVDRSSKIPDLMHIFSQVPKVGQLAHDYDLIGFSGQKIVAAHAEVLRESFEVLMRGLGFNLSTIELTQERESYVHFNHDATEFTFELARDVWTSSILQMLEPDYEPTLKFFVDKEVEFETPVRAWFYRALKKIGSQWVSNAPISKIEVTRRDSYISDEGRWDTYLVLRLERGEEFLGFTELIQEFRPELKEERGSTAHWTDWVPFLGDWD
jgi:hypothetical protein